MIALRKRVVGDDGVKAIALSLVKRGAKVIARTGGKGGQRQHKTAHNR
jgi:hypothetical protein